MESITLTVSGVEIIKEGFKKNGEPYALKKITSSTGKKASTFLDGIQPGQTYYFLMETSQFKGKDNQMHDSFNLVGFDNVKYEQEKRPINPKPSAPSGAGQNTPPMEPRMAAPQTTLNAPTSDGFTQKDRETAEASLKVLKAIYQSMNGAPIEGV